MKPRLAHGECGSALVEAAIVFPLFSFVIAGAVQFAYAYGILMDLKSASAVGARAAVLGTQQSTSQVCAAALNAMQGMIDTTRVTCDTTPQSLPTTANTAITITLTYPAPLLIAQSSLSSETTWTLRARTTMQ